jgi:hypothetical protein
MRRSKTGVAGSPGSAEKAQDDPRALCTDVARENDLDDGDQVTWTVGKETFCPVKFHAFEVGPISVTTRVRPREATGAALARARAVANVAWNEEYEEKLAGHLERVRQASGAAREP